MPSPDGPAGPSQTHAAGGVKRSRNGSCPPESCAGRAESSTVGWRMRQRVLSAVSLFLLLANALAAMGPRPAPLPSQRCACDERLCRCRHNHRGPTKPKCHFPNGVAPGQVSLQSCSNSDEHSLSAQPYLPAAPVEATPAVPVVLESPPLVVFPLSVFLEADTPPPRSLPS